MSNELIFVLFIFSPFIVGTIILAILQRKFLLRYKEVMSSGEPVSMDDLNELINKNPSKAYSFLKKNGLSFLFLRGRLYYKKYKDIKLNRYARIIRIAFTALFLIPIIGIISLLLSSI